MAGTYKTLDDAIDAEVLRLYDLAVRYGLPLNEEVRGRLPRTAVRCGYIKDKFDGDTKVWYCTNPTSEAFALLVGHTFLEILDENEGQKDWVPFQ